MKTTMKNIIGCLMAAVFTCLTMPAIAAPPDSPPKAEPAVVNDNVSDRDLVFRPIDVAIPAVLDIQRMPIAVREDAILTAAYVVPLDLGEYRRLFDLRPRFRVGPVGLRPMSTAPPGFA